MLARLCSRLVQICSADLFLGTRQRFLDAILSGAPPSQAAQRARRACPPSAPGARCLPATPPTCGAVARIELYLPQVEIMAEGDHVSGESVGGQRGAAASP